MPNRARASSRAVNAVGALAVLGCAGVVLGAALPWLDTGGVKRSAFTMARIANEFGVIDTTVRRSAIVALLFTPIVASIVVLLLAFHRNRLAGLVSLPMGIAGLGSGTIGTRFTSKHLPGPLVCLVAGAICIVGAWGLLLVPKPQELDYEHEPDGRPINTMSDDPTLAGSPVDPTTGASTESVNATESGPAEPVTPPVPSKGRGGRIALGVVGIVGIVAGGAFAYTQLTGGEKANTPEQAVEGFYRAFERRDFIGMSKSLAPGERDVLLDSMVPMVSELSRLEILKKDFTLDKVDGYTAKVSNYKAKSKRIRSDLAAVTVTGGNLQASIDPKNLPFGDFIRKQFGKQLDEAEASTSTEPLRVGTESAPLIVQKIGKRWYISGNYSLAESARRDSDNPFAVPAKGSGVPAKGAASPEAAVSEFLQAGADLNLRRVIELLPPDEFAALHDYAGQFIVDAERSTADLQKQYTFKLSPKLATTSLASDRRIVTIVDLPMTFNAVFNEQKVDVEYKNKTAKAVFSSNGKEDLRADYRGDCLTIVQEGDTKKGCGRDGLAKLFTDLTGTPIDFTSLPATTGGLSGPCGKFSQPKLGFTVIKRDGLWYVSPFRTMLDTMTNSMKVLDRKDLDCLVKETKKVVDENQENLLPTGDDGGSDSATFDTTFDTIPFDSTDTTPITDDPFASDTFASGPLVDTPACREMDRVEQAGEEPGLELARQCMADAFGIASDTAGEAAPDTTAVA